MKRVALLCILSIAYSQYCYSYDTLSPHCPNAFLNGTIEIILNSDSTSVDHLQQQIETSITPYFELNPGHWIISVSSFSDFSFCAPTIVRSLLTSCVVINRKKEIIAIVMKMISHQIVRKEFTELSEQTSSLQLHATLIY